MGSLIEGVISSSTAILAKLLLMSYKPGGMPKGKTVFKVASLMLGTHRTDVYTGVASESNRHGLMLAKEFEQQLGYHRISSHLTIFCNSFTTAFRS